MGKKRNTDGANPTPRAPRAPDIPWATNVGLTWSIVDFFIQNPSFRRRYFSDSTEAAQKEDRTKTTGKDSKTSMNQQLAEHVFAQHEDFKELYQASPARFGTSTGQRLTRLRKLYKEHLAELGATGAGVRREDVADGSELHNLHEKILKTFPWWYELDGFWHELPNINPIAVTSAKPGADHVGDARRLVDPSFAQDLDGLGDEEQELMLDDPKANMDDDGADDEHTVEYPASRASRSPVPAANSGAQESRPPSPPFFENSDNSPRPVSHARSSSVTSGSVQRRSTSTATPSRATPSRSTTAPAQAKPSASTPSAAKSSATTTSSKTPAPRKDKDAVSKLASMREVDAERQMQKRKLESEEMLARIGAAQSVKKAKYEYKLMRAKQKQELKLAQLELDRERLRAAGPSQINPPTQAAGAAVHPPVGPAGGLALHDMNIDLNFASNLPLDLDPHFKPPV